MYSGNDWVSETTIIRNGMSLLNTHSSNLSLPFCFDISVKPSMLVLLFIARFRLWSEQRSLVIVHLGNFGTHCGGPDQVHILFWLVCTVYLPRQKLMTKVISTPFCTTWAAGTLPFPHNSPSPDTVHHQVNKPISHAWALFLAMGLRASCCCLWSRSQWCPLRMGALNPDRAEEL